MAYTFPPVPKFDRCTSCMMEFVEQTLARYGGVCGRCAMSATKFMHEKPIMSATKFMHVKVRCPGCMNEYKQETLDKTGQGICTRCVIKKQFGVLADKDSICTECAREFKGHVKNGLCPPCANKDILNVPLNIQCDCGKIHRSLADFGESNGFCDMSLYIQLVKIINSKNTN